MTNRVLCALLVWLTISIGTQALAQETTPLLISGGAVIDGTGRPAHMADIRIANGRITAVGKLRPGPNERVIDAHGLVVAPGFIDTHSHADGGLFENPDAETQIRQGITTSIVGQDGGHQFPLANWFAQLESKHVALNIAAFVGHGTIRAQVLGENYKRAATPAEIEKMAALVDQEMRAGGLGLSSGLEYDPGFYSTTEELIACAKAAAKYHGLYISHVRDEGNEAIKAFTELIRIGEEARLPAQISHIKLDTSPAWGKAGDVLKRMADARSRGVDITADVYPYLYWQSTITALIPTRDWDDRAIWEKGLAEVGGAEHVRLTTYTPDPSWQGKTIPEIAAMTGKDPISVIQQIVHATHEPGKPQSESVVVTAMTEADLDAFLSNPFIMFCTDGSLHGTHPRGAGSYPRILGVYVRERHLLSLEEAIRKATSLPAKRMGLRDRGLIRPGMHADLVLFDPTTVKDAATIADPTAHPTGIPTVLVNGTVVLENGTITGRHPGQVLRRR